MELASQEYDNNIFGRRFGVLVDKEIKPCARHPSNMELLQYYSIPATHIDECLNNSTYPKLIDDNIQYCVSIKMRASITENLLEHVEFVDGIAFNSSESSNNFQCSHMTKSPTTLD